MATSVLGHYVRFGESAIDEIDPVDSGMAGRALGNLNHIADQYAQRRIAWVSVDGDTLDTDPNDIVADTPWRLYTSGEFDVHVHQTGESYRFRLRLRVQSGDASDEATFSAVLAPVGESLVELHRAGPNVADIAVIGASFTWEDAAALLYLDAERVTAASRSVATINEAGGDPVAGQWLRVQLTVWVSVEDTTSVASLGGVQLDEYVEP